MAIKTQPTDGVGIKQLKRKRRTKFIKHIRSNGYLLITPGGRVEMCSVIGVLNTNGRVGGSIIVQVDSVLRA